MKDFLGQELTVGDRVIIPDVNGYDGFTWGIIEKFTPKMVRVSCKSNYSKLKDPRFILKLSEEQQNMLLIKAIMQ